MMLFYRPRKRLTERGRATELTVGGGYQEHKASIIENPELQAAPTKYALLVGVAALCGRARAR